MDLRMIQDALKQSRDIEEFSATVSEDGWREFYIQSGQDEHETVIGKIEEKFGRSALLKSIRFNNRTNQEGMEE